MKMLFFRNDYLHRFHNITWNNIIKWFVMKCKHVRSWIIHFIISRLKSNLHSIFTNALEPFQNSLDIAFVLSIVYDIINGIVL